MASMTVASGEGARRGLERGMNRLADAVKVTLGRNVVPCGTPPRSGPVP